MGVKILPTECKTNGMILVKFPVNIHVSQGGDPVEFNIVQTYNKIVKRYKNKTITTPNNK